MVPVVFDVYTVAPCGSMQLHVAPVVFAGTHLDFTIFELTAEFMLDFCLCM